MLYISLLRGINVGGNKIIAMSDLRALYESLGFQDVETLLQSGNVVFRAAKADARKIEAAIQKKFGMDVTVILRTHHDLVEIIRRNPFEKRGVEPGKLVVVFLSDEPNAAAARALTESYAGPEEAHVTGREMYVYYPDGQGRSKFTHTLIEKTLGVSGTARNWNTVKKLEATGA
jgi:uncharacterized protein (DUF1697 family)